MGLIKRKITNALAKECIQVYEDKELQLNLSSDYYKLKNEILQNKKICISQMEKFIVNTRHYPYSKFAELREKGRKNSKGSITYDIKFNSCLYISFNVFTKECLHELKELLKRNKCKILIFDLRNNTGGDLEVCVELCDIFMKNCEIVKLQYKEKEVSYKAYDAQLIFDKIYILVGKGTMSSSEIFTLSMYSNVNNVVVLGSGTYQKNVGQINYISHKYHYIFTVTAYYWTVNGLNINDFQKNIISVEENDLDAYLKYIYDDIIMQ